MSEVECAAYTKVTDALMATARDMLEVVVERMEYNAYPIDLVERNRRRATTALGLLRKVTPETDPEERASLLANVAIMEAEVLGLLGGAAK